MNFDITKINIFQIETKKDKKMSEKFTIPDFDKTAINLKKDAMYIAKKESIKFFEDSFRKKGFTNTSFVAWKETNNPFKGNGTMHNKGNLMRSLRIVEQSDNKMIVESDTPYSEIHNNGGYITVTAQMKKYFWAKYYEFAGKVKKTKRGRMSQAKANLKVNAKAEFCKRMALMKVGTKIKIPQRQFMGHRFI